ncbi:MAG: NAD-dependent epimerase/dehydratase family protein [Halobacteriales archaeon]
MNLRDKRVVVAGGAGFVGSHLVDCLVVDNEVVVVDDLSNGDVDPIPADATFIEGDLTDPDVTGQAITGDVDAVFHLAADKDPSRDDVTQYRYNNRITENLLDRMDEVGVDKLAFTSSSVIYGEAPRPTPEDFAPMEPISIYGASKLGEEALLSVYAHSHDFTVWSFRFANVVGPRLQWGVINDFIAKLQDDPETLEILGDGRQEKSYMHVTECVEAMIHVVEHGGAPVNTYNLGTRTTTSVDRIADIVSDAMELDPDYKYTGGDRGWVGDVPRMRLSIEKLSALGYEPGLSSDDAVKRATQEMLDERT